MELVKKILVTGVGGNVAQGIIRNINSDYSDIHITGVNVDTFSAGNHLCDVFYKVPYASDKIYIDFIKQIVIDNQIDLIIPSTNYEVYELSKNKEKIQCPIAVSDEFATEICLDKMETYSHFLKNNINSPWKKVGITNYQSQTGELGFTISSN